MQFDGAVIKEQGVTFAIAVVRQDVINNRTEADKLISLFQNCVFGQIPVILISQAPKGIPSYYGRQDIVKLLSRVPLQAIPWRKYTVSLP